MSETGVTPWIPAVSKTNSLEEIMAVRKRFKPEERTVFVVNAEVEWLNSSTWRPGVIVSSIETDDRGRQSVGVRNKGTTRTIRDGQYVTGTPGAVRLRSGNTTPDGAVGEPSAPVPAPKHAAQPPQESGLF
jgi:hypothetical protein